jgi:hypothetical protein
MEAAGPWSGEQMRHPLKPPGRLVLVASLAAAWSAPGLDASPARAASQQEEQEENAFAVEQQTALFRHSPPWPTATYALAIDVSGHGLASPRSGASAFALAEKAAEDKALGINWRPWSDTNLEVGMNINQPAGHPHNPIESDLSWQYGWERRGNGPGALGFGLSAHGAVGMLRPGLSQTLASSVGVQLIRSSDWFSAQAALSPQVSFDAVAKTWEASVVPEIRAGTVLTPSSSHFRSVLNVRLGYRLAPETSPELSAGIELRISPDR